MGTPSRTATLGGTEGWRRNPTSLTPRLFGDEVSNGSEMCFRCTSLLAGALGYLVDINFHEAPMTKPKARASRKKQSEPSLAEQRAVLVRELVRQIEAERADGKAGSPHKRGRKKPLKAA
jgi:hypothetical protein